MSSLYYAEMGVEIHCGRVEDVLATIDPRTVALLSADVPYGVNEQTKRKSKGRGNDNGRGNAKWTGRDFAPVEGDNKPFDPSQLLAFGRPSVLWGANHYASRLPDSSAWIVWDKRDGDRHNDNSDTELAWTNLGGPMRIFRHLWMGLVRASEAGDPSLAPTQKPVALFSWLFSWRTKPGDLIVTPYAGSGPDVLAARNLGRRIIAIECVEAYCEVIKQRLVKAPIFPMFAPPPIATAEPARTLFDRVIP